MMRATLVIAALSALAASPAAAGGEWPDGPNKQWFKGLQRPDNHNFPDRDLDSMTCCGPGDVVKTKFRVELATIREMFCTRCLMTSGSAFPKIESSPIMRRMGKRICS